MLAALLRAEATASGAPVALARYDAYRRDLADRLGVDPDPALQRVHQELLASDDPVRSGVRYDPDELLGRAEDLAGLRSLVRSGRLTTILGPGGLGKTRVAHVLAREASQSRVHFVELVGISSPDDVRLRGRLRSGGPALGDRPAHPDARAAGGRPRPDRPGARLRPDPARARQLRARPRRRRLAGRVPPVTTRDLRVVTTSRAPLGIAAERVFPLSQLAAADGAELFRRRARAVRPDAELPDDLVAEIVERLDGLPLAVELAAARVRTMSVDEVRRALDDRFALLRGRDRSAPARHQTLTAVIGWSWDLLAADEQRALAWLSVFQDGFSARRRPRPARPRWCRTWSRRWSTSRCVGVAEHRGAARYRMLETVREFGALRLAELGETDAAREALTTWAVEPADRQGAELFGPRQVEAVDLLDSEEANLADVLRRLLLAGDAPRGVRMLAALGGLWSVTGNFPRFLAMADLAEQVLRRGCLRPSSRR